ncbi:hypothetical protein ACS0TY_028187 [Phlomoides rotata]
MVKRLSLAADALHDVRKSMRKGIRLHDELKKCRRLVEEENIDSDYQNFLRLLLGKAKENVSHKRGRGNIYDDLVEDSDGVNDPQCVVNHKTDAEGLVGKDKECLYQMPGGRNKGKRVVEEDTNSKYQHFSHFVLGKAKINESHKRKRGDVYIDQVEDSDGANDPQYMVNHRAHYEELVRMDKGHLCHMPGRRYNWVTENLCGTHGDQARHREKDKVCSGVYLEQLHKGKTVIGEDGGANRKTVVQSGKAKINESHKWKRGDDYIDLLEDSDGANDPQYMVYHKADAEELVGIVKGHLCNIPGRRYNRVTENLCGKCGDQAQRHEKDKVCSRYLEQLRKGKNVIGEDGGANTKTVVWSDSEQLHQKPSHKNEHIDQAQSIGKFKEQMGAKFKGRNKVKVEHKAKKVVVIGQARPIGKFKEQMGAKFKGRNKVKVEHKAKKVVVLANNENFNQGRRNNCAVRNHCERVDRQPGKKVVVIGQRESINVGQGKHGLSHQKAAFENYSVKNEPDDGVKSKIGSVKTAFGKDVVHGQRKLMKVGQGDCGFSHQQAAFGNYSVKKEPDKGVKILSHTKEVQSKIRSVKTRKCLVTYKKGFEMIKEGNDKNLPDVEIMDSAAIFEGMLSPFVPSTTHNDLPNPLCPTLDEFRKELLEVLKKPYDIEEYKQHREAIQIGSYFEHYPDLKKKLTIHRYKRKKCLTILRGFFFWLQNVCREGAFKPWKDGQCLAVEPGSP